MEITQRIEEAKQEINTRIQQELATQLRNIPKLVEDAVTGSILSILGIRKTPKGYDVDTWGSSNPLNDYIKNRVNDTMQRHVGPLVDKEMARILKFKTLPRNISEACVKQSEYTFTREVKDQMDKAFKRLAQVYAEQVQKFLEESMKDANKINTDIMDPNSFEGILGEVLLEEQARLAVEG